MVNLDETINGWCAKVHETFFQALLDETPDWEMKEKTMFFVYDHFTTPIFTKFYPEFDHTGFLDRAPLLNGVTHALYLLLTFLQKRI